MSDKNIEKLLSDLADVTAEPVRKGLGEDIKNRIPHKLTSHKGKDTINIMIDLRISKLTAAAAIIITIILCVNFLGDKTTNNLGFVQESKLLVNYFFTGGNKVIENNEYAGMEKFYNELRNQGENVVYYGNTIKHGDGESILMSIKTPEGKYRIIFGDMKSKTITAEELIELQSKMLLKK
ncbi:MAG TPA: hypothetical protein PLP05_01755 [Sedimentisphaerales bacterium]|nr:hypothetical protein [Sedimentisphaerales bacterium]